MKIGIFKRLILAVLAIAIAGGMIFSPLVHSPLQARAQGLPSLDQIAISAAFCALAPRIQSLMASAVTLVENLIDSVIDSAIDTAAEQAEKAAINALNAAGAVAGLPGIGSILGKTGIFSGGPQKVNVVKDKPAKTKETANCLSAGVKRAFIRAAVSDVLKFVRGDGLPRYITNFPEVIESAADRAGAIIVSDLINRNICSPFQASVQILVQRAAFPRQEFDRRISCTLSRAIDIQGGQLDRFVNDFRDGSWGAWLSLHESQNTLLGAYLIAEGERQRILEVEKDGAKLQAQAGRGLKDVTQCKEVVFTYNTPRGAVKSPPAALTSSIEVGSPAWQQLIASNGAANATCTKEEIKTPGSVVAGQVDKAVSAQLDNLINSQEWHGIVREVMTALISDILKNGFPISI